jgi:excisionase family DNA binding protein
MEQRLIGIKELSIYLGVSINTIRSWVWRKLIPYLKIGRLVKFDIIEINNWLKDKRVKELESK